MLAMNGMLRAGFIVSVPEAVISGAACSISGAVSCAVLMSNSLNLDAAKQAIGLEDKNGDDHRQRNRQLHSVADPWTVGACQILQHADHEAAGDGSGGAAQAAEDGVDETVEQHAAHHVRLKEDHRCDH